MSNIRRYTAGRTLFLAVLAVTTLIGTASAKTVCNSCKGTGKVLEVTKQCPLHQPLLGRCANCDGSGLVGPRCPYCEGLGYILTPAEKEALRKERAEADARAQAEGRELAAKRAREDSIAAVEKKNKDADLKARGITNGRSRADIQRTFMQNMAALRFQFEKRLKARPELKGKVTVKLTVNEFGTVGSVDIVESTVLDQEFEAIVVSKIKTWDFGKIDKPGDVTETTYPILFRD